MKRSNYLIILSCLLGLVFNSCKDLDEMNINPNDVDPSIADPSLMLSTIIVGSGTTTVNFGFGDIAGVMQHTQKDGWSSGHNAYEWGVTSHSWGDFYDNLRNAKEIYRRAYEMGNEFYMGVARLFMAYNFGIITDMWGDAPFSEALKGNEGLKTPKYDPQEDIYRGILKYLEEANTRLAKSQNYSISSKQDVLYAGNVSKWRKFANSLAIRYYLRISEKLPEFAAAGIKEILDDPNTYPLILDSADDAAFVYPGNNNNTAWTCNTVYNVLETGNWMRLKMCATLVDEMRGRPNDPDPANNEPNDPRLAVWANKITTPLVLDPSQDVNYDVTSGGQRVIGDSVAIRYLESFNNEVPINYNKDYIGIQPSFGPGAYVYNLHFTNQQASRNPHASHISDLYQKATDPLLKARMLSAAEMHFSLAEIALKGWGGNAKDHYEAGIKASLETWGVGNQYSTYISRSDVAYKGTLEQIIVQKWIASWTAAVEAWCDYRRTGFPALKPGLSVRRNAIPLRLFYQENELNYNEDKVTEAIERLETTNYNLSGEGKNTAWSRMWLLQNNGNKPW